jgi:hypothetical protein
LGVRPTLQVVVAFIAELEEGPPTVAALDV